MSVLIAKCIATRKGSTTAKTIPKITIPVGLMDPSEIKTNDMVHSGSVPLDQIWNKSVELAREFERRLKEDVATFLFLKVPQDTGLLVYNYVLNWMRRDIFLQGLELSSDDANVPYAPFVEEAVGRQWKKGSAVDHAIEITREHILAIYPAILEAAARATGMDAEVQHLGL